MQTQNNLKVKTVIIDFIKNNKWPVGLFLVLALFFYWFQIRPSQLFSECNKIALEKTKERFGNTFVNTARDYYESAYKQCLRDRGMER